jgi:hypothetical protein
MAAYWCGVLRRLTSRDLTDALLTDGSRTELLVPPVENFGGTAPKSQ